MLAIGISFYYEGFFGSRSTDDATREAVEKLLRAEFGVEFDEFLVVSNDEVADYWKGR